MWQTARVRIAILIPSFNEELTLKACIDSCLAQTRPLDQIVVVDDSSTDATPEILKSYGDKITAVRTPKNSGGKSYAQEYGVQFIDADVMAMTDADTVLAPHFIERVEKAFENSDVHALAGYIQSQQHNWLTACRELDYIIGQDLHKTAQSHLESVIVIPGCGAAFRVSTFKKYITFDHDTVAEDLDFTYKLHKHNFQIYFDKKAVVYTQDPETMGAYVKQMRRWIGGGWQNVVKHWPVITKRRGHAVEIALAYMEGLVFVPVFLFLLTINVFYLLYFMVSYLVISVIVGSYAAWRRKRYDLLYYAPTFPFVLIVNSYIFWEQFFKRVVFQQKDTTWYTPKRRNFRDV